MYRLFVPGTLTALQSASFYGKEPRDLNCSKFLLQQIRKVEYEALTTTKQDIYPSLIDNMHFSFLSDILLGCYPPIWKDRLEQLIKTVGNENIEIVLPKRSEMPECFFYWACRSNLVIYPKGFVAIETRKNQFFNISKKKLIEGFDFLVNHAEEKNIALKTIEKKKENNKKDIEVKLLHQKFLNKFGFRLKFFGDFDRDQFVSNPPRYRKSYISSTIRLLSSRNTRKKIASDIDYAISNLKL